MNKNTNILSTHDLEIGYGPKSLCRNINLEVRRGELVCLFGQNGVGKSTLIKTLSKVITPLSGNINIGGISISDIDQNELAEQIGIVTTEKVSAPNMTVRDLVSLGRYPYTNWLGKLSTNDLQIVNESISKCKIDYIAAKPIDELSDGQRQKAMIARVIAQDSQIIFLDEPTAHLDVVNSAEVMILLSELRKNKCIIISTHDLNLSMQFADQLWLMNFDKPLETGYPEDLALAGTISDSFYQKDFHVDILSGQVSQGKPDERTVQVHGESEAIEWSKRALKRNRIGINNDSDFQVYVEIINGRLHWKSVAPDQVTKGMSIRNLIQLLKS